MIDFQAINKKLKENESKNKAFVLSETDKKIDDFINSIDEHQPNNQDQPQKPIIPSKNILTTQEWDSMTHKEQVVKAYKREKPVFNLIQELFEGDVYETMDLKENASNALKMGYKETFVSDKENILNFVNPNRIENIFENEFSIR